MAKNKKKNKKQNRQTNEGLVKAEVAQNVEIVEPDVVEEKQVEVKKEKTDKKDKSSKTRKPRKSLLAKVKETNSELKKVSWPKFGKVAKATGVVIIVVAICTLLLFGLDMALKYGVYDQII